MPSIWFIRHGQSESNAGLRTSDPALPRLTERGHQQAKHIAQAFSRAPDLIVTSPYVRTGATAKYTLERFDKVHSEEWPIQEFTYLAPAGVANTNTAERKPKVNAYWQRSDPTYVDGEGAESFAAFLGRVQALLERLNKADAEFIAVFGHSGFTKALLQIMLNGTGPVNSEWMQEYKHIDDGIWVPNASIWKVELAKVAQDTHPHVTGFSTAHLPAELVT